MPFSYAVGLLVVKWSSLPYEDSTWELAEDVDIPKIEQFKKFRETPPEENRKVGHYLFYLKDYNKNE